MTSLKLLLQEYTYKNVLKPSKKAKKKAAGTVILPQKAKVLLFPPPLHTEICLLYTGGDVVELSEGGGTWNMASFQGNGTLLKILGMAEIST